MAIKTYRVKHTLLIRRDPTTKSKTRYYKGQEIKLPEEEAAQYMQKGPGIVRGMAIEPVDESDSNVGTPATAESEDKPSRSGKS